MYDKTTCTHYVSLDDDPDEGEQEEKEAEAVKCGAGRHEQQGECSLKAMQEDETCSLRERLIAHAENAAFQAAMQRMLSLPGRNAAEEEDDDDEESVPGNPGRDAEKRVRKYRDQLFKNFL